MRLHGKIAIVTGAGRGIGKAIAARFCREGARVALAEIDADVGEEAAAELAQEDGVAKAYRADVSEPEQVRRLVEATISEFGGLDILVNNAAVAAHPFRANLAEMPLECWRTVMKANLESIMLMSQAAAGPMRARGGGYIVNMSSVMYLLGAAELSAYQVAKGAMVTLTRSVALDFAPYGIVVNGIAPGWIDTRHNVEIMADPEWQQAYLHSGRIPLRRAGQPDEIASIALALADGDFSYMTGQTLIADGGMCLTL